jgi:hypothetical protein
MPIQPLQLDDRSFEQLYAEAISRVPVHTPEWTNFNESDPGVTIVQLFAFMTENLLYRSNRIPEANRRKFLSLLNIGLQPATPAQGLLSFNNDRGPVQAIPLDFGQQVLAGKVAYTTRTPVNVLPVTAVGFYKKPQPALDDATKQQYRQFYQTFLESDIDQLLLYQSKQLDAPAVGKPLPVVDLIQDTIDSSLWLALVGPPNVPIDTVRQAIAGQTITLGIYPSVQSSGPSLPPLTSPENTPTLDPGLNFYIAAPLPAPTTPGVGTGDPRYTRLKPDYAEDVLDNPGIVQLTLPAYPNLLLWDFGPEEDGTGDYPPLVENTDLKSRIVTWLRIRLPLPPPPKTARQAGSTTAQSQTGGQQGSGGANGSTNRQARLTWVGVNAARILQSVPVVKEPLGVGTGGPDQTYRLANTPVIMPDVLQAHAMIGATSAGTFALEVQNDDGGWDTWQLIDDLYAARPTDKYYTLDPEAGSVTFGSGINGFRPPINKNIRMNYEYGGGSAGQVAIGAINKSAVPLPGGMKVENPLQTWGASDGQSVSDGERSITHYLRNRDRCVTASDFSDVTLHTPGVSLGRAEVLPLFNPLMFNAENATQTWPGTVTIMVIPQYDQAHPDTPEPDFLTLNTIGAWLDQRRLVTTEVYVRGPQYISIWVTVGITAMRGQVREVVQKRVMDAIRAYLSPLVGGPPAGSGPTLESDCPPDSSGNGACGNQEGTGWPLSKDVHSSDLLAVAMRVPGVQTVNSLYLGWKLPGDIHITKKDYVPMVGLQLPRLEGIGASIGEADDPADLFGQPPSGGDGGTPPPNTTPVPTLPAKC